MSFTSINAQILSRDNILLSLQANKDQRDLYLKTHWDFYEGRHQAYFRQFEAEDDRKFRKRLNNALIDNFCRAVVDKSVSYLYGQGEKIVRRFKDPKASELMRTVYEFNDMPNFMTNVATMGGVEGNALIKRTFVDSRTDEPFEGGVTTEDKIKYGVIKYLLISGLIYTPVYRLQDYNKLTGIILNYIEDNFSGVTQIDQLLEKKFTRTEVLEFTSNEQWLRWERDPDEPNSNWKQVQVNPGTAFENKNPYGSLDVVYTEFENLPLPNVHEGQSDLDDLLNLNLMLDERGTDEAYTIIHHVWPILVVIGAQIKDFVRTARSVLQLPIGASAQYLTWDNKIEALQKHRENIIKAISRLAGIPPISWGELGDLGSLRSGAALRVAFAPAIEKTQRKQKTYGRGEKHLARGTMKMWEFHTEQKFSDYSMEMHYPLDFIPTDDLNTAQIAQLELQMGIRARKDEVARRYPDLTADEIDKKVKEIEEETERFSQKSSKLPEILRPSSTQKSAEQEQA